MHYRNWKDPQIEDWENRSEGEIQSLLGLGLGFGFACYPRHYCSPRRYCWPRQGCWPR